MKNGGLVLKWRLGYSQNDSEADKFTAEGEERRQEKQVEGIKGEAGKSLCSCDFGLEWWYGSEARQGKVGPQRWCLGMLVLSATKQQRRSEGEKDGPSLDKLGRPML